MFLRVSRCGIIHLFVIMTAFTLLAGCTTLTDTIRHLDSPVMAIDPVPINPDLSEPERGVHFSVGATYGTGDLAEFLEPDIPVSILQLSGGIWIQPSLKSDRLFGWFAGVDGALACTDVSVKLASAGTPMPATYQSLFPVKDTEWNTREQLKAGFVGKFYVVTASVYGLAGAAYETGSYRDFRSTIDGVGNFYDMAANPLSFSWGGGLDLSVGYTGVWAFGALVEGNTYLNQTRTYVSEHEVDTGPYTILGQTYYANSTLVASTAPGGTRNVFGSLNGELYLDVFHLRAAGGVSSFGGFYWSLFYRL